MSRAEEVLGRIVVARKYSMMFFQDVDETLWYQQPAGAATHLAWQLGHLAIAEYRLGLQQIRGHRPEDDALVPSTLMERYGKGSEPTADPAKNHTVAELREILDKIHQQVLQEVPTYSDALLEEEPALGKHPMFETKGAALEWCAGHELVHAGQVALLRRLFGKAPLR
jgi:hypothetical protein